MENPVLELVASYEQRLSTVDSLISNTYETTADSEEAFESLCHTQDENERLMTSLREILAQHRSFRRKDFDKLVNQTFGNVQISKQAIELERKQLRDSLTVYIRSQKQLIASLRGRLSDFASGSCNQEKLEIALNEIKKNYLGEGEHVFAQLRNFRLKVRTFCREQQILNDRIQRLLERGENLSLEDFRQFDAIRVNDQRRDQREIRREEVEILLARFRDERQNTGAARVTTG
jgi:hypothetical protein